MFRPKLRVLVALSLVLLASRQLYAQRDSDPSLPGSSLEISGQVRSDDGRKMAMDVMVRLERFSGGLVDQVATDSTGRFRFSRLRPGQYVLSVKTDGFAASSSQVDISEFIPRQYVILQLQPVGETFRHRESAAGIVDARVPQSARLEFDKGRIALQEKRAEEAVRHLEKAIEIYRDFFEAQSMLGDAHMELRQWQKAEGALRRALEIRPKTPDTLISLGEVYRREKKYKEAEKSLVESLKLERASWRGHFTLGRVYWETDEVLKAAPHVGQAIELKPDYPEARILAGNIFMRLNMPQNALVEYEEYLRLAPGGEFAAQTRENVEKLRKALPKK